MEFQEYEHQMERVKRQAPGHPGIFLASQLHEQGFPDPTIHVEVNSQDMSLVWNTDDKEIVVLIDVCKDGSLFTLIRYHGITYSYHGEAGVKMAKQALAQMVELDA